MFGPLFLKDLFPTRLKPDVQELYTTVTIQNLALAMVAIFEPVYLYESGYSLSTICLFYAGVYFLYIWLMPLGAKFCLRWGYEKGIAVGTVLWVVFYICLAASVGSLNWLYAAMVIYALQKTFYWTGYHAKFAQYSDPQEQGREIGGINALDSIAKVIGPIIGGLLLLVGGFKLLFIVVAGLMLVSIVAILINPKHFKPEAMRYGDLWRFLWHKKNRSLRWQSFAYGEELIAIVVWPVIMAVAVGSDNMVLGGVVAAATLLTAIFTLYIGNLTDRHSPRAVLGYGVLIYFISWLVRPFASSVGAVLGADALSRFSKNTVAVPFVQGLYSEAQNDNRVMKRVASFELGLSIAKMIMALIAAVVVAAGLPVWLVFILSGFVTLLYLL